MRGQAGNWRTDTRTHTQATTIPEGQNWPRIKRHRLFRVGIHIINLRRSSDCLWLIMGIPISVNGVFLVNRVPWEFQYNIKQRTSKPFASAMGYNLCEYCKIVRYRFMYSSAYLCWAPIIGFICHAYCWYSIRLTHWTFLYRMSEPFTNNLQYIFSIMFWPMPILNQQGVCDSERIIFRI